MHVDADEAGVGNAGERVDADADVHADVHVDVQMYLYYACGGFDVLCVMQFLHNICIMYYVSNFT